MQIIDNKALLLKLRNPKQITTIIPKSNAVGEHEVLVNWGVQEAHTLRGMNIKVPSPIEGRYGWTGKFAPMAHQRTTASFLTLNQKAFCFNEAGCVDSETEYLSPTGWIKLSEYSGGKVAQYDPATGGAEFVEPSAYVKLPCEDMLRVKTKYGLDQLLSPEHRVLLVDGKKRARKTETVSAEVLAARQHMYFSGVRAKLGGTKGGTDTISLSGAAIPTTFLHTPDGSMPYTDAQLRVLVAVIADGHFGSGTKHCSVRLKKERKKVRLRALLSAAEIAFVERACLPEGFSRFTFVAPERWKEFGEAFWSASVGQREVIAGEVLHWDGCTTRGARFSSSSKASADYVQYVFASLLHKDNGGTARVTSRKRRGSVEYTVQIRRGTDRLYVLGKAPTITVEPSTDGFKYCFMVPSTYLLFRRNGCIFASGNTGKTASAIWAADFLMKQGIVKRALVVCPISIMDSAWRADLFSFAMHRTVGIAYGDAKKRRKIIAGQPDFLIINYDGVEIVKEDIAAAGYDLIIVDEASHYKNAQSKRWKVLNSLVKPDTWLWMMTGTPAAQGPEDAFGLAKLVNPAGVPKFFGAWKDRVMLKVSQFRWIPKENSEFTVHRALQPAIRYTKDECLDLPDMTYVKRDVALTRQQEVYYKRLKNQMAMEVAGEQITAVNAAVMMGKLLQISAGASYTESGDTVQFDIGNRYNVLKEVIAESTHKVLIFVPFKHVIDMLSEQLTKDGVTNEVIRGDVSAGARTDIFKRFQEQPDPRVLVIQPQSAAHGVTLTAANTVVWWSPTSSLETYAQANARAHRKGQTNKCTVVQLQGSGVERRMYKLLDDKIDVHTKVVDLYKEMLD